MFATPLGLPPASVTALGQLSRTSNGSIITQRPAVSTTPQFPAIRLRAWVRPRALMPQLERAWVADTSEVFDCAKIAAVRHTCSSNQSDLARMPRTSFWRTHSDTFEFRLDGRPSLQEILRTRMGLESRKSVPAGCRTKRDQDSRDGIQKPMAVSRSAKSWGRGASGVCVVPAAWWIRLSISRSAAG